MFNYISCIGGIYGNHTGQIMKFSTFLDYHSTLSSYYSIIQSTNQQISTINCNIYSHFHSYVSTKYKYVLPPSMIKLKTYLSNQGVPAQFITNDSIYIPGDTSSAFKYYPPNSSNNLIVIPSDSRK